MSLFHNRMENMATEALQIPAKTRILRKMVEVVMWEWNAVKEGRWEELPGYTSKKQQLVEQMADFDWTPLTVEKENPEILILESQIIDLEYQVRKMLENRMNVISTQLSDLKRRHNVWRRTINPYRQVATIMQ